MTDEARELYDPIAFESCMYVEEHCRKTGRCYFNPKTHRQVCLTIDRLYERQGVPKRQPDPIMMLARALVAAIDSNEPITWEQTA